MLIKKFIGSFKNEDLLPKIVGYIHILKFLPVHNRRKSFCFLNILEIFLLSLKPACMAKSEAVGR